MKSKEQLLEIVSKANSDQYEYINNLFKFLPNTIAQEFQYVEIKANEKIIEAGKPCQMVYILLDGEIEGVDYYRTGSIYSFLDFSKMHVLGDFELFTNTPEYMISIFTSKTCKMLKISSDRYLSWIQHDENALFLRLSSVLSTLTFERKRDREYLRMGCKERVVSYLTSFYEKELGLTAKNIRIPITQAELAEKVNYNIRSVQRAVASLEETKMVAIENGKMILSHEQYMKLKENQN